MICGSACFMVGWSLFFPKGEIELSLDPRSRPTYTTMGMDVASLRQPCLRLLGLLIILGPISFARAQTVARLGSMSWSYEATGIYPPSHNLPAHVSVQVRIDARADTDTVTGTGLWELTIFGNTEVDGSGANRYDERTGLLGDDERAQSFTPSAKLAFDGDTQFDLSGLACGAAGPFFCVEVTRADGASADFQLDGSWIGCRSTPCYYPDESADAGRQVSFSDLSLDLSAPSVPNDEPVDIIIALTAVPSDTSRRQVEGTGLWKVSIFGSKTSDGSGSDRYDERPQILTTSENTDKSLMGDQTLELTIHTQFLLGGVGCDDFPYFCVTLDKGESPEPDFEIERPITHCSELSCLYPDDPPIPTARFSEMALTLELPPNYPYEQEANINLMVALTPSQSPAVPTSAIEGSDLWRLAIFGHKNKNGTDGERFDERPQVLSDQDQDAILSPSDWLIFNVTTPFVIGKVGCVEFPYFCVEFVKGYNPVPDFIFASTVRGCLEVPCVHDALPVARPARLSWTFTNVGDGFYGEPVPISLNVQIEPSESPITDPIEGSRLWKVSIYGSQSADGSGDYRFDERSVLTTCQGEKALLPQETLQFDIDAEFIITGVGCPDVPYFCVTFAKGDGPEPEFIMYDPLTACAELACTPPPVPRFIVTGLSLKVKSGSPTSVVAGKDGSTNYLKFVMEVIYDKNQVGEISGSNLWILALWGSANADGTGPKISEMLNTLTSLQSKTVVTLGNDFILNSVRNRFDMTGATCDDVGYVCVKLSRGSAPADVYEFLTEPESYVPQACVQMGCS